MAHNAQQEAVALWQFLTSRGFEPSMNSICRALRDQGVKFRQGELYRALSPFVGPGPQRKIGSQPAIPRVAPGNQKSLTREAPGSQPANSRVAASREKEVSLVRIAVPSALPAKNSQAGRKNNPQPNHRALRLPLDAEVQVARRAILAAVWALLARTPFAATITRTEWGKRNNRTALDLANLNVTPEQCVSAWHSATKRLGTPARTLAIVQDELGRIALPQAVKPTDKPTGARPEQWVRCAGCTRVRRPRDMKPSADDPQKLLCEICAPSEHAA